MADYLRNREWADKFIELQRNIILKNTLKYDFNKSKKYIKEYFLEKNIKPMKEKKENFIKNFISLEYDHDKDCNENTDLTYYLYAALSFALRIRNLKTKYFENNNKRDITIRSYKNGDNTEIKKIIDGFGDYMLYCWGLMQNNEPIIKDYILLNLDKFRDNHEKWRTDKDISNHDGSKFNCYSIREIIKAGAAIDFDLNNFKL
jgi:hypothetical protein